jgi:hypothetical protein
MKVSTAQKLGIAARIATRMTAARAGRSRTLTAAWRGAQVTATHFGRVLGILWLEVTGFVFLCLAAIGGFALSREYAKYQAGKIGPGRVILAVCFILMFGWFGVSSFWRSRRKS